MIQSVGIRPFHLLSSDLWSGDRRRRPCTIRSERADDGYNATWERIRGSPDIQICLHKYVESSASSPQHMQTNPSYFFHAPSIPNNPRLSGWTSYPVVGLEAKAVLFLHPSLQSPSPHLPLFAAPATPRCPPRKEGGRPEWLLCDQTAPSDRPSDGLSPSLFGQKERRNAHQCVQSQSVDGVKAPFFTSP